jgi:membrane protein DedA with SNARE-associated domain
VAENLFPPIPSEAIMPLAGFAAARGQMSLPGVIAAGVAGSVAGNAVWFEAARAFGTARVYRLLDRCGHWAGLGQAEMRQAEAALRRNGAAAVFLTRLMPGLRTVISIPAGLVEMPRWVFYIWTALGSAVWTGGLALAGYALEDRFHLVEEWAGPVGFGIMALVMGGIGWRLWQARRTG